ncbi:MAG: M48 family metalloprotease, partial [Burkholderiaceae bacterium]
MRWPRRQKNTQAKHHTLGWRRWAVIAVLLPSLACGQTGLPALGDGGALTLAQEARLGQRLVAQLWRRDAVLPDAWLADYLAQAWAPLWVAAQDLGLVAPELVPRYRWQVLPINDASLNAFAMPGAVVGVHVGLVARAPSVDALASVLAHELTHVTQRHISRMLAQRARDTPLWMAALLLGVAAAGSDPSLAQAAMAGAPALAAQRGLNFSRDMEREADRVGQQVLAVAGYRPEALGQMLALLREANQLNDDGAFAYLRSHPLGTERVAEASSRLVGLPPVRVGENGVARPNAAWHDWMRARAQVAISDSPEQWLAWQRQSVALTSDASATAQWQAWRAALAAAKGQQSDQAWRVLDALAAVVPSASAQADAVLGLRLRLWGQTPQAPAEQIMPLVRRALAGSRRALWLDATEAAVRVGMARELAATLRPWLSLHPNA